MRHHTRSMTRGPLAAIDRLRDDIAALRAQVEELKGENKRFRMMLEDIYRAAYPPVFWTTEPGRILRALQEDVRKQLGGGRTSYEVMLGEVKDQRDRATSAEAERDEARGRVEKLRAALDYVVRDLEMRSNLKRGDDKGLVDIGDGAYRQAKAALAECGEVA